MSSYFKLGTFVPGLTTTPTAGGNTALSASSSPVQEFTGTQAQTITLPDATTLKVARRFDICNRSTQAITVNNFGGALIATIPADSQRYFLVTDISTSNGSWQVAGVSSGGGSSSGVGSSDKLKLLSGIAGLYYNSDTIFSREVKTNPEELGGNYWLSKANTIASVQGDTATMNLNGYLYTVATAGSTPNGATAAATVTRFNDDSNYWITRTNYSVVVYANVAASIGGFGFGFGGNDSANTVCREGYKYTDTIDTWSAIATAPLAKAYQSVAVAAGLVNLMGGQTIGGVTGNAIYQYDYLLNAYYTSTLLSSGSGRRIAGGFAIGDLGYLVGGRDNSNVYQQNTDIFNFAIKNISVGPNISATKVTSGSSALGFGYITGGTDSGSSSVATVEQLNPSNSAWVTKTPLSVARRLPAGSSSLNGAIYATAGMTESANTARNTHETYVPCTFVSLGILKRSVASPTSVLASVLVNNLSNGLPVQVRTDGDAWKTFVAGTDSVLKTGESLSAKFKYQPLAYYTGGTDGSSVQSVNNLYNVNSNAWISRQTQAAGRQQQSGFSLDGNGYVLCGYDGAAAVNENKYYNEITNTFTTRANPNSAHRDCSGSSLNDYGYIYVTATAGITADATQRFLQYSSALNAFTSKTVLTTDVYSAPMVSLSDRLWVQGGQNSSGTVQQLNQSYSDITNSWTNKTAIGFVRDHHGGFAMNDKTYVVAGEQGGSPSNALETYNVGTDSWTHSGSGTGDLPVSMEFNTGFVSDGYGYTIGGYTGSFTARFYQFNPFNFVWTSKTTDGVRANSASGYAPAPYRNYEVRVGVPAYYPGIGNGAWMARANMNSGQAPNVTFAIGDTAYGAYGLANVGGSGRVNWLQAFKPAINTWYTDTPGNLSGADTGGACSSVVLSGRGFVNGHNDNGSLDGGTQVYDPILRAWTTLASGGGSGQGNQNFVLNGYAYSSSGGPGVPASQNATYRYDPSTNAWSSNIATLANAHYGAGAAVINGLVHVAGGQNSTHEQFNDSGNVWISRNSLPNSWQVSGQPVIRDGWHIAAPWQGGATTVHYVYKQETNLFSANTAYPASVSFSAGCAVGDDMHNYGGYNGSYTALTYSWVYTLKNIILGMALEIK